MRTGSRAAGWAKPWSTACWTPCWWPEPWLPASATARSRSPAWSCSGRSSNERAASPGPCSPRWPAWRREPRATCGSRSHDASSRCSSRPRSGSVVTETTPSSLHCWARRSMPAWRLRLTGRRAGNRSRTWTCAGWSSGCRRGSAELPSKPFGLRPGWRASVPRPTSVIGRSRSGADCTAPRSPGQTGPRGCCGARWTDRPLGYARPATRSWVATSTSGTG